MTASIALFLASGLAMGAPATTDIVAEAVEIVRERFYDPEAVDLHWADLDLPAQAASPTTVINQALDRLGTSHTGHYTPDEPAYYELLDIYLRGDAREGMFSDGISYVGIELFTQVINGSHFITGVRHGGPAAEAGLLVGDELLTADGEPFHPIHSFAGKSGEEVRLTVRRIAEGEPMHIDVTPHNIQPNDSFERAMHDSATIIDAHDKRVGYIRPWSYAGQRYHDVLVEVLSTGTLAEADGLILDLRGGWGGASPDHAELFLGGGPIMSIVTREGTQHMVSFRWRKPLVVLIDHGTRSGKEVLAHSFRAAGIPLVGTNTAGAVVGGQAFVLSDDSLLLVAVVDVIVDGGRLEGVGVAPTHPVPFDIRYAAGNDPQLSRAIDLLTH